MMYRLLVIGRKDENVLLYDKLARNKLYSIELADNASTAIQKLNEGRVHLSIFNLDLFTKEKVRLATDMRDLGFDFPILILSRIISRDSYNTISDMEKTILLEKPYEDKDLWGIVDKQVQGRQVYQRYHRRFYTDQRAMFETFEGGQKIETNVYNLSRGGAYFEQEEVKLKVGDLVRLNVELTEVSRKYSVNAKVVWTTSKGWRKGMPGAGVEFLKAGDVYRNLLSKI